MDQDERGRGGERGGKWSRQRAVVLRDVASMAGREQDDGGARRARRLPSEWVWQRISALKSTRSGMKAYYSPDISLARSPPCVCELVGHKFHFHIGRGDILLFIIERKLSEDLPRICVILHASVKYLEL